MIHFKFNQRSENYLTGLNLNLVNVIRKAIETSRQVDKNTL
ncbi:TPA: hypothetical protein ACXEMW_003232 [Proteus mirabilis]